ncbi:hypothetical protein [Microvirga antarctica]|uniref:hypothetical protein n=1 Tax=Microvirga antarctica TaxID=2819233 RepID=UPI001FE2F0C7|nr:hypothetical protein [Microvirga antarctica]
MKMIATKSMTYATRRLNAGDVFDAKPRDARILRAVKKARYDAATDSDEAIGHDAARPADLAELRVEYEKLVGKRPFMGWDAATLREKIANRTEG